MDTVTAPHFDKTITFTPDGIHKWNKSHLSEWDYLGAASATSGRGSCSLRVRRIDARTWEASATRKGIDGTATGRTRNEAAWNAMVSGRKS